MSAYATKLEMDRIKEILRERAADCHDPGVYAWWIQLLAHLYRLSFKHTAEVAYEQGDWPLYRYAVAAWTRSLETAPYYRPTPDAWSRS